MAYFLEKNEAIVSSILGFPTITESSVQLFNCVSGERAGFRIINLKQTDGTTFQISQIYNYTTGAPVLLGTVSVVPGLDLCGGLFSSGVWCTGDPMNADTKFYQVDYV